MITHIIGSDTRLLFEWIDSADLPMPISAATFTVKDRDDNTVTISSSLTYEDGAVRIHIQDTDTTSAANYAYTVTATSGTDKQIISAGLLRIKAP